MKIKPYVERLSSSKAYRDFSKKHDDAFMIAGFFIIDLETNNNLHQIDYYVPKEKKIAAFTVDKGVTMQMLDMMNNKLTPEKLDLKTNIDLDALPGILGDEMKNRNITEEIKKIIAIVQTVEGKKIWNLNCVLSGMGLLKAHVDDESKTILKMEKSNIMDYLKKLPAGGLKDLKGIAGGGKKESDAEIKEKLKNLNKLEQEIETEKKRYEKEMGKGKKDEKNQEDGKDEDSEAEEPEEVEAPEEE
jgi:hypothetical protein